MKLDKLTYAGLKSMKKGGYLKAFKSLALWKKAVSILFLGKYKFIDGRVNLVAIPFRKHNKAVKCFKEEVKKDRSYNAKMTVLGSLEHIQDERGIVLRVVPSLGNMNVDFLNVYANSLFDRINITVEIISGSGVTDQENKQSPAKIGAGEESPAEWTERFNKTANGVIERLEHFRRIASPSNTSRISVEIDSCAEVYENLKNETLRKGDISDAEEKRLHQLEQLIEELRDFIKDIDLMASTFLNIRDILDKLS